MTPRQPGAGREWALVGLAWLAIAVCTTVWLTLDTRSPEWDHANHLERAVSCAHDLTAHDWRLIVERASFYPPVVPCAAGLVYRLMPTDAAAGEIVMLLFLAGGMAATCALGRALGGGSAGVAAAWIFGTARVRLVPATGRPFAIAVDRARVGWLTLPRMLVDWVAHNFDPTPQIAARLAFRSTSHASA